MDCYGVVSASEELPSSCLSQKRMSGRSDRALYVPSAKRIQLSKNERDVRSPQVGDGRDISACKRRQHRPANIFQDNISAPNSMKSSISREESSWSVKSKSYSNTEKPLCSYDVKSGAESLSGLELHHRIGLNYLQLGPSVCSAAEIGPECEGRKEHGRKEKSGPQRLNRLSSLSNDLEDAELTASILSSIPTSYDDFQTKELHLKLERNVSSPLTSRLSPTTNGSQKSRNAVPSSVSTMHPNFDESNMQPDAEDLEVAMINESFEEQQKQTKLYDNPGLKDLFYSDTASHSRTSKVTASQKVSAHQADRIAVDGSSQVPREQRLPYTAEINKKTGKQGVVDERELVYPLNDKNGNDGLEEPPSRGMSGNEVLPQFDTIFYRQSPIDSDHDFGSVFRNSSEDGSTPEFDMEELILSGDDSTLRRESKKSSGDFSEFRGDYEDNAPSKSRRDFVISAKTTASANLTIPSRDSSKAHVISSVDEKMDATEALAVDVVESLFSCSGPVGNHSPTSAFVEDVPGAPAGGVISDFEPLIEDDTRGSRDSNIALKSLSDEFGPDSKDEAVVPICDTVNSWEELDSDDFDSKLVDEIQSAMGKVKIQKPRIDYFAFPAPKTVTWNAKELPHVLEGYGLPQKATQNDVEEALARFDCADVAFHKVDDARYLIVFASAKAATHALIVVRHPWLKLRSMCEASEESQKIARNFAAMLRPHKPRPETTVVVARRLVEGALGRRSNITDEQRRAERKKYDDAKLRKKEKDALWKEKA